MTSVPTVFSINSKIYWEVAGRVLSNNKENLANATVTVIQEPTQNKYVSLTRDNGYFHFFNIKPGGPYK